MAIVLENESLRAEFNERTGTLVSLTAKASGWNLVRRRELGLSFRMHVPIPDRRKHYVIGEQQSLVRWQLSPDGETLTLIWKDLVSQHAGTLDITFTGTARLDDSGLHFTGTVENDSQYTVEAVAWPCVGDIRQSGKGSSLYRLNPLFYSAQKLPLLPEHQGDKGYWGQTYQRVPSSAPPSCCWRRTAHAAGMSAFTTSSKENSSRTFLRCTRGTWIRIRASFQEKRRSPAT